MTDTPRTEAEPLTSDEEARLRQNIVDLARFPAHTTWVNTIASLFATIDKERAEAATPDAGEGLEVERLARAMEDVFPGWIDEAPGTAEAEAEMRSYAEMLDAAYRRLADSASPPRDSSR